MQKKTQRNRMQYKQNTVSNGMSNYVTRTRKSLEHSFIYTRSHCWTFWKFRNQQHQNDLIYPFPRERIWFCLVTSQLTTSTTPLSGLVTYLVNAKSTVDNTPCAIANLASLFRLVFPFIPLTMCSSRVEAAKLVVKVCVCVFGSCNSGTFFGVLLRPSSVS